jgi:hypothetical protein
MAAGLGFKTFTTGDVLTAGDTNGYLMQGVWVFADDAARTAAVTSPQEGNMSFLKDTNSTEYYSGSAWVAVSAGATSKVVQIVSATYATEVLSSSTTFADTGLTATITPTSASNKVLVFVSQQGCMKSAGNQYSGLYLKLLRASTNIADFLVNGLYTETTVRMSGFGNSTYVLDTPATTSATTYKTQFKNGQAAAEVGVQKDSAVSSIVLMEVTP